MKHKHLIKAVAFSLIFVILFSYATRVVTVSSDDNEYQWISGIYEEPKDSLDAVYIGSSNCYAFWNSNTAWNNYGIAVHPFTCSSMSLLAAEYVVKEMRKNQPNAVYIININTFREKALTSVALHRLVDFMPLSINKLQLTNYLCNIKGLSWDEKMEYFFPMIRYHSKWEDLEKYNFSTDLNGLKGGDTRKWALKNSVDLSAEYIVSDEYADISENLVKSLDSFLDYCDKEQLKVVFVAVPQAADSLEYVGQINTIIKTVSDRGYTALDLLNNYQDLNIDPSTDYYNNNHTNVHGALKFTNYICEYLIDNYGFEDKRDNKDYDSWNESFKEYSETASQYVLDFELDFDSQRDYSLESPKDLNCNNESNKITVSWSQTENATGYAVYKRTSKTSWEAVAYADKTEFTDTDVKSGTTYYYTVVPYYTENGEKVYGNFLYNGIEVKHS